ncbi:MAG: ADP-glyceromanno-heptose 6-epimerase [Sediminibacterium sp.]
MSAATESVSTHGPCIVVTGAAGFIGSCIVKWLNEHGYTQLLLVDDFGEEEKRRNWESTQFIRNVERHAFFDWLEENPLSIDLIIHLGARTDTTEFNYAIHEELNLKYSEAIWHFATQKNIPLIYASSAATYGAGEMGYSDDHQFPDKLHPLNPYGVSKNEFDKWALKQSAKDSPPYWTGLKFFNVYGPNEYHKHRMASVIWHAVLQIEQKGYVQLFRSHREGYKDGEQLRDFIYVKDIEKVIGWMAEKMLAKNWTEEKNGLYNLGTGKARTFNDLVGACFKALRLPTKIEYINMPEDIRDKYQYFTEAEMQKLRTAGYTEPMYTLEEGVSDYVANYLHPVRYR